MLCYVVLCLCLCYVYVMFILCLCYVYVMLCYIILYYVILCYIMLYYIILYYIILYYIILYYIILYVVFLFPLNVPSRDNCFLVMLISNIVITPSSCKRSTDVADIQRAAQVFGNSAVKCQRYTSVCGLKRRTGHWSVLHRLSGKLIQGRRITGVCQARFQNCKEKRRLNFVMSVRLSAGNNWATNRRIFLGNLTFECISKIYRQNSSLIKILQE